MKLYIHYEPEDITLILKWSGGSLDQLKTDFVSICQEKHNKIFNPKELVLTNTRKKILDEALLKKLSEGDDVFVWIKEVPKDNQSTTEKPQKGFPSSQTTKPPTFPPLQKSLQFPSPQYQPLPPLQAQPPEDPSPEAPLPQSHSLIPQPVKNYCILEDPPFPPFFVGSCPICGEFLEYESSAKSVYCDTCGATCVPVTFVDAQVNCARCNKLLFRHRGKKVIKCPCGLRSASIACPSCRVPFVFPEGYEVVPCIQCGNQIHTSQAIVNAIPKLSLLINKDVNEPKGWEPEFQSKITFSKKINLVTQWYIDESPERQKEIDYTLERNIICRHVDKIHLLVENASDVPEKFSLNEKITVTEIGHRWKFSDAFAYCNKWLVDEICIVANSDIYFDQSINYLLRQSLKGKFITLTRHDETTDTYQFNEWLAPICQDTWIFEAPVPDTIQSDFYFGWMGCDNRIAYEFKKAAYHIMNPALKIISRHVHMSGKRNYTEENKVIGEYAAVPPNGDM